MLWLGRLVLAAQGGWHGYSPEPEVKLVTVRIGTDLLHGSLCCLGSLGGAGYLFRPSPPPALPRVLVADIDPSRLGSLRSAVTRLAAAPPAATQVDALDRLARLLDILYSTPRQRRGLSRSPDDMGLLNGLPLANGTIPSVYPVSVVSATLNQGIEGPLDVGRRVIRGPRVRGFTRYGDHV